MSTILEVVTSPEVIAPPNNKLPLHKTNCGRHHIKKTKEKYFKHKYCKDLKRKLKKYKLRHNGEEDQDVLDVSLILVSNLKIKSPKTQEDRNKLIDELGEEQRPRNYLFKMGRRKQTVSKNVSDGMTSMECETNISSSMTVTAKDLNESSKVLKEKPDIANLINDKAVDNGNDKKTNAFKLMMESRNKSIGINSPGKEKNLEACELEEAIENKKLKVKRSLILQKMAEEKGALKNKEIEEYQDKLIKKKMDQRAQRLKKMITNHDKSTKKDANKLMNSKPVALESVNKNNDDVLSKKNLKLINLFKEPEIKSPKVDKKPISKEDQEFFNKLSPSIKKKENMLSYFKKIEKEDEYEKNNIDENECNTVIKVKLSSKAKKKTKKKKLSLNKDIGNDHLHENGNVEIDDSKPKSNTETIFSKEDNQNKTAKEMKKHDDEKRAKKCKFLNSNATVNDEVIRPRRNIKRPAKYMDEVELMSSDEELHIFTPKKKKPVDSKYDNKSKMCVSDEITNIVIKPEKQPKKTIKIMKKEDNSQKKTSKLAPIFNAKPTLDAAAIEAKQRFLSSGVPDKLKKKTEKHNVKRIGSNNFNAVVHVQQIKPNVCKLHDYVFDLRPIEEDISLNVANENGFFNKLLCNINHKNKQSILSQLSSKSKVLELLQSIKQINPKFPVYRTYRLLRDKSKGEFRGSNIHDLDNSIEVINGMVDINHESLDTLNWTEKYKPMASKQILGNFDVTKELKKWLISWTENNVKTNRQNGDESDFSDFYQSDSDSMDSIRSNNNLLILTGPVGSGKTSMVYALAAELAIKVLEVNASSKRTGKIMLQDLQEATQSHKVNRGKSSSQEYSQKSQEITESKELKKSNKHRKSKKKTPSNKTNHLNSEQLSQSQSSQESTRTCMSLILIDDADIVFDQDDGFCSAIVQLIQCSKRPVILITSTTTCPHLQRFLNNAKIMHTRPFVPNILGPWLDIMCLTENNICWPGLGAQFLDYFNGDIRKTINYLQFYLSKESINETENCSQNTDCFKVDVEDENSNMCWSDSDGTDNKSEALCINNNNAHNVWQDFMMDQVLHYTSPMRLFDVWWNIPTILDVPHELQKEIKCNQQSKKENTKLSHLDVLTNALDAISVSDCFSKYQNDNNFTDNPWLCRESHCVSEQESSETYNCCKETMAEISHTLVSGSIVDVQNNLGLESKTYLSLPGFIERRKRDQMLLRHNNVTKYMNPTAALDRKALALDYWSGSRTICRIERTKTDSNLKRNNRFCHYLKSVNVLCNSETFDHLCGSLSVSEDH